MVASDSKTHSKYYQTALWIIAILIISSGIYLSFTGFMNTEWLSRAGCLVVMLGIWSGLGGILQERILVSHTQWRRRRTITAAKAKLDREKNNPEEVEKRIAEINETFDNHISKATQNLRVSIGILEMSLLLTGTFLWGFGDLLIGLIT